MMDIHKPLLLNELGGAGGVVHGLLDDPELVEVILSLRQCLLNHRGRPD